MTGVHTGVRPGLRASPIPGSELQAWALTPWPREDTINNRSRALFPGPERFRSLISFPSTLAGPHLPLPL